MVQTYGMTPFVSGIRTVGLYDTGDLSGYHDVVIERTLAVGKELVAQGAQAIIPLGGKIYPYVVTPEELEPHLGVPVINTKAVGVSYAELMARNNIKHSIKAYPCPTGLDPDAVSAAFEVTASQVELQWLQSNHYEIKLTLLRRSVGNDYRWRRTFF